MATNKKNVSGITPEDKRTKAAIKAYLPIFISENPFSRYGIHGIGIGPKSVQSKSTESICLRFYVECKLSPDLLSLDRKIPDHITIPITPDHSLEVPTDVIEMPRPSLAMEDPESLLRPVPGGASISVPGSGGNGTLGAWVLDKTDETVVGLSNRHVLGGNNGAVVIQPGSNDGGSAPADRIGTVKRNVAFQLAPANPTPADCNFVDAAILMADDPALIDLTVIDLSPAIYLIDTASIGDPVQKTGQTTGYTTGTIVDESYNVLIPVPITPGNFQDVVFCDCYLIEGDDSLPLPGFSSFGDSGAVIFGFAPEQDAVIHPAIGLNFAIADGRSVACKIQYVFNELDLDVLCASGYPAYLDGIAEGAEPDPRIAATRFTGSERRTRAAGRRKAGLARDVQRRLRASQAGQTLVNFLNIHRHEILTMLIRGGDVRRATTAALEPLLLGAFTSKDVLNYCLDQEDVKRIGLIADCLQTEGSKTLQRDFACLALTQKDIAGKTVAKVLGLD